MGYRNLWTPFAELYHYESATRGYETTPEKIERFKREESFMKDRWKDALDAYPYYNPNFTLHGTPFTLAYPPRLGVEESFTASSIRGVMRPNLGAESIRTLYDDVLTKGASVSARRCCNSLPTGRRHAACQKGSGQF